MSDDERKIDKQYYIKLGEEIKAAKKQIEFLIDKLARDEVKVKDIEDWNIEFDHQLAVCSSSMVYILKVNPIEHEEHGIPIDCMFCGTLPNQGHNKGCVWMEATKFIKSGPTRQLTTPDKVFRADIEQQISRIRR